MPSEDDKRKQGNLGLWLAVSVLWLVSIFLIANQFGNGIASLRPNEFGDLLAGAFAPIAAFWFVYTVFLQREELSDTKKTLERQIKALEIQARASQKTALINEQRYHSERFRRNWENRTYPSESGKE